MLIQTAKTRKRIQIAAANRRSPTSRYNNPKLNTWDTTANTGFDTRRNDHDRKISSSTMSSWHLYGKRHRHKVRQKPSEASLLGSPSWSENLWCRRCRFTQVIGLI